MADENALRREVYRKHADTEEALALVNRFLADADASGLPAGNRPRRPTLLVVGTQRSGSTVLMQLLANAFDVAYPDNIVARFWGAPFVGMIVSDSLRRQMGGRADVSYESDYGVAADPFGPHEFGYFWTKYFRFEPTHQLTDEALASVPVDRFGRDLFLIEHVADRPLVFKAVAVSLNLDFLASHLPTARFILLRRDPLYVAQSTYTARLQRYGSDAVWWSLKPAEYPDLVSLPPVEQVAAQVALSIRRIDACLSRVDAGRTLSLDYEALCESPADAVARLEEFLGPEVPRRDVRLPDGFPNGNLRKVRAETFARLSEAVRRYLDAPSEERP